MPSDEEREEYLGKYTEKVQMSLEQLDEDYGVNIVYGGEVRTSKIDSDGSDTISSGTLHFKEEFGKITITCEGRVLVEDYTFSDAAVLVRKVEEKEEEKNTVYLYTDTEKEPLDLPTKGEEWNISREPLFILRHQVFVDKKCTKRKDAFFVRTFKTFKKSGDCYAVLHSTTKSRPVKPMLQQVKDNETIRIASVDISLK